MIMVIWGSQMTGVHILTEREVILKYLGKKDGEEE